MLIPARFRSKFARSPISCSLCLSVAGLIALTSIQAAEEAVAPPANEPATFGRSEPVAEEVDIFKQRAREIARQERQESKNKKSSTAPTVSNWFNMSPTPTEDTSDGFGILGRGGYLAGKTFGRTTSIAPVEIMPYVLSDESFVFADVRGFISNYSRYGGNVGVGYRHLREDLNAWGGASVWYDVDDTSTKTFQQVGVSLELLFHQVEVRGNLYFPVTSSQTYSSTVTNAQIVGNQLLYGRLIDSATSLKGFDAEIGYSVPIMDQHVIRGFVGGYHFEGDSVNAVNGFKARIEGTYNNGPTAQVLYTNDVLYGNNIMVGVTVQFPFANNHPTSGWKRNTPSPFRYVERNYNVALDRHVNEYGNQKAINPATGQPYNVGQVSAPVINPLAGPSMASLMAPPDGTSNNPYYTAQQAQNDGRDLIFVRNGSVLTDPITLTSGQRLIGEGSYQALIPVAGGQAVPLQMPTSNNTQAPMFSSVSGNSLTLASNTEVAGLIFSGSSGYSIVGSGVSNVSIHDIKVLSAGSDAINLSNSSGDINLSRIQINGATGSGIAIDQGTANINFNGLGTTITAQGDGLALSNLTGGTVTVNNLNVTGTGVAGVRLDNVKTDVTFSGLTASQTQGPAVSISGNTGQVQTINGVATNVYNTYAFNGNTTITSPKTTGFSVNGTDAIINVNSLSVTSTAANPAVSLVNNSSSPITFNQLTLNTANGKGLYAVGLNLLAINGGTINTTGAPAIDIQNSTINTTLTSVSANGGAFGIGLNQSNGLFTITGNGSVGTGGTIQNSTNGLLINQFGTATINWVNFASNGVAIQSNKSSQLSVSGLQVSNSTGYAIDSLDDAVLIVSNSGFSGNGGLAGGTIRVQADALGTFQSLIQGNTISDANGTAIAFATLPSGTHASLATTVQSNTINGNFGGSPLIGVNWNGPSSLKFANNVLNANAASMTGIRVQNTAATDSMSMLASGNAITFASTANMGTGISVISAGNSQLQVLQNSINFKATGGIGLRFDLDASSTDYIAANLITDEAGGATGMLFDNVAANTRMQIDGNTINLLSTDLTTHQGIIFTSVTPTIQFTGTANNLIYNASPQSVFSIPVNAATGGFYINGQLVN